MESNKDYIRFNKDVYTNNDFSFIVGQNIFYYDIEDAGYNILKWKLKDSDLNIGTLNDIKLINKTSRTKLAKNIEIGKLIRKNIILKNHIEDGLEEIRNWFYYKNKIQKDVLLSVKRDAIYLINKCVNKVKFNNYVRFNLKNNYTSYFNINRLEFYCKNTSFIFSKSMEVDVKNISEDIWKNSKFVELLKDIFLHFEELYLTKKPMLFKYMIDIRNKYLEKKLDIEYYRELNRQNLFRLNKKFSNKDIFLKECNEIDIINIGFNYIKYIIPLFQLLV